MSGIKGKRWILRSHFDGMPKRENVELVEEELPQLKDGEFMLEALWLSLDPYLRPYSIHFALNQTIMGGQVARIIQSRNEKYAVGDYVFAMCGWATHSICDDDTVFPFMPITKLSLPPEQLHQALYVYGLIGTTAYLGLLEICQPKEGETLVVSGAAGAVGSLVGQIGKIKGCRVVGLAGSDAKVEYLKSIGFDAAYNYKTITSLKDKMKEACPKGIDLFFDNVGGETFSNIVSMMNLFGRVSLCGAISEYNLPDDEPLVPSVARNVVFNQIKIEGFIVKRWEDKVPEALKDLKQWMNEGKLKTKEHVVQGFENMFDAFLGLFRGDNIGKLLVKV